MAIVTIPFDYDDRDSYIIPIFVNDCGPNGELIARGWIDAVVEMADRFRRLARVLSGRRLALFRAGRRERSGYVGASPR